MPSDFDQLVAEALSRPLVGWDLSWLGERLREGPLPWDYTAMVEELSSDSLDLLDLGTGGGEWLASLGHRPARTVATEAWPPDLAVARTRLLPLEVDVVAYEGPPQNSSQHGSEPALPFPDQSFHLISDRHEAFVASEIARVLRPGGHFVTQQVGGWDELGRLLGSPPPPRADWNLAAAKAQLESAGLAVVGAGEARPVTTCTDVGALVWYLTKLPWAFPDFELERYRERLLELHRRSLAGPIEFAEGRFCALAQKPGLNAPGPAPW